MKILVLSLGSILCSLIMAGENGIGPIGSSAPPAPADKAEKEKHASKRKLAKEIPLQEYIQSAISDEQFAADCLTALRVVIQKDGVLILVTSKGERPIAIPRLSIIRFLAFLSLNPNRSKAVDDLWKGLELQIEKEKVDAGRHWFDGLIFEGTAARRA